ncbi:MAG TPA: ATP-binding cassette domain-containing protein [Gemmatimonadaceae bacterium]|nr:ATP-binding cassette domain-containing protein [Gemmatimonadaceae bacterium]
MAEQSAADPSQAALEVRAITKHFGKTVALDGVTLSVRRGSIHALLGENGAGKTTLMRIAFGMISPDAGVIFRNGKAVEFRSPADAIQARIGMVHQQFSLIPAMTVVENVALGGCGIYRPGAIAEQIRQISRATGLALNPYASVADLTGAERQKLEIIRTLAHDAEILILDEPTAVLTDHDTRELFAQLRRFADTGGSVVLITHKLDDALEHANDVSVLHRGRLVFNGPVTGLTRDALMTAMVGSTPTAFRSKGGQPLDADQTRPNVSMTVRLFETDIEIRGGEILGVAALEGAAATFLRSLAGRVITTPAVNPPRNVGFVPENRLDEALIPAMTLVENVALKNAGERRGLIDWSDMESLTEEIIRDFDVRADGPHANAENLSGGNQQRFVLGRELSGSPPMLILENPTQGLDINAAATVHEGIRAARGAGTAVVFYSSDLDELALVADRVIVIGRQSIMTSAPDRDQIGRFLLLGAEDTGRTLG